MDRGNRCFALLVLFAFPYSSSAQDPAAVNQYAHDTLKQLIEINTTDSVGDVTTAAEAMARRLREAGFEDKDVIVAGPTEKKKNLVARLHGTGKHKPILFLGHLDVVEARREDWTTDPFQLVEKDGFFYGRGTEDMKEGDAILISNFIRLKKEGFVSDRDLILALTADEEGGNYNGVDWLIKEHRDWIDAQYSINLDGGEFIEQKGKRLYASIQASEKVYADFQFESLNPGGHSSIPSKDNAIYHLADALARLENFSFPAQVNEITRNYFQHTADLAPAKLAADLRALAGPTPDPAAVARVSSGFPYYNALLRTACVATMLSGGHASNALPQTARANVNCRIFPGEDPEHVRKTLEHVIADPKVTITPVLVRDANGVPVSLVTVPPSPLLPEVTHAMDKTVRAMWGDLPIIASMSTGATDGRITRTAGIPTYGIACLFFEINDNRAHGKDERIGIQQFYEGVEFNYRLMKELSAKN